MRVLKFGGTSLSNANQFIHVANILEKNAQEEKIAAVLSAPAMITNNLISVINHTLNGSSVLEHIHNIETIFNTLLKDIAHIQSGFNYITLNLILEQEFIHLKNLLHGISLLKFCPDNVNANIICLGEKLSIILMEELLNARNLQITVINPVDNLVAQGKEYLASMVNIEESARRIKNIPISHLDIMLMAGFTAGNDQGELVALGRNGSDYSAAILAACLGASRCEIWTDVDGIYTCDPHQVPNAKLLNSLSYQEAMELSYFGAKILHPRTILPIAQFHIPCLIKNVFKPNAPGTLIGPINNDTTNIVKGITYLNDMVMLNISGPGMKGMIGMAARVFSAMSKAICSVVLITQSSSEYSISFCVPYQELSKACAALNEEFNLELKNGLLEPIDIIQDLAIISVVGDGMRTQLGLSNKLFGALARANINIIAIAQGSSERSISVVVKNNIAAMGIRVAHQMLFSTDRLIEVFIIGSGGVGTALIEQIRRQRHWLKNKHIDLRVCGIINSRMMCIDINGIDLNRWESSLNKNCESCNLKKLIEIIKENHLLNPVVVDCTSSIDVVNCYVDFLLNGCHVITPNKQANTGSMEQYRMLRDIVIKSRKKFLYDTNVGAGLPVIENLQNLLNAGDKLISFSGILSGSLSFIFGKLDEGLSLSAATLLAQKKGYTEPDPRDDLSGIDVARKLLILAREVGYELELNDIQVDPVIPHNFISKNDTDNFLKKLSLLDNVIFDKYQRAYKLGHVLRYVGNIQEGRCCVKIESINNNHPLFRVKDGENALAFFTRYYQPIPLVLRGYGAGNNVTAAGVFADLLRTLS
ncbi:bifunctional aspartate kinase/homoserine dehydrogenase I [Blochmannia endosymbiont of Camponotus sp. C-046]|uniref:bifunctional aspartate kinase/homoserine dehydrogenase I n=1 Tax=Blochmannia endosymbiont of Camponotus sp. C-046 TaxID=2945589 RepID=UPI002024A084|nr:bifunctional aspartate kinase/homoserine dehydrogenase I [Blochmannia endosymbiont of Camponotus sp. C-046]URJ28595.1 bifunctional aspartate kinase/homoserine dehydrogenase I [Blochmannia endosymbiont of Camponotus sp. C-046]